MQGKNMETVKGVFRSALKKTIQTQCNCKIDISNDNISCKGVVQFTGNLNTEGMNNIDVSSIVGVWARNVNSRRIRISMLTTLTISRVSQLQQSTLAMQIQWMISTVLLRQQVPRWRSCDPQL